MDFNIIINQIIVLFIILFLGYFITKKNIIDDHSSKKISSLVVNISAPALIISAMMKESSLTNKEIVSILLISIIVYICLFLMTYIVPKILKVNNEDMGIYKFMIMFSNVGFMGFPVISSIYGQEAIFYASIYNLPFNVLIYTLGIYFVSMNNREKQKFQLSKIINPGTIAVIIGLFVFSFKIQMPYFISETIDMVGSLTTPLSMIVIGSSLTNVKFRNIFSNVRLYICSILKLVVFPVLILLVIRNLGLNEVMTGVPVIITGMPVAANAVILSKEFGGNDSLASEGVFISTMISFITIPLLVYLLS